MFPVDACGGFLVEGGAAILRIDRVPDFDFMNLADLSVADVFGALLDGHFGAPLGADLNDTLVRFGGVDHREAFLDRAAGGLLGVHVFAGLAGVNHHDRVPVIRGGDNDGVDVLAFEDLSIVLVGEGISTDDLRVAGDVVGIDVAERADLDARHVVEAADVIAATAAGANIGDDDLIVGAGASLLGENVVGDDVGERKAGRTSRGRGLVVSATG